MFGHLFVSKREWARHQRELHAALKRASDAEDRLDAERQSKDWIMVQLASRIVTKNGGYGLDHEQPERSPKPTPHPKAWTHEPSETDLAKLEYYKKSYREAGKSEEEAELIWEAEMRGETPRYPYEELEVEQ